MCCLTDTQQKQNATNKQRTDLHQQRIIQSHTRIYADCLSELIPMKHTCLWHVTGENSKDRGQKKHANFGSIWHKPEYT